MNWNLRSRRVDLSKARFHVGLGHFIVALSLSSPLTVQAQCPSNSADLHTESSTVDQDTAPPKLDHKSATSRRARKGQFIVTEENDALAVGSGSDEFYTQGIRFSYAYAANCEPRSARTAGSWVQHSFVARSLGFSNPAKYSVHTTLALGQHFFTPTNLSNPELIADDRPYAGWLYLSGRLDFNESETDSVGKRVHQIDSLGEWFYQSQHSFELQVGVVGPSAQGEWVQANFHKLINDEDPKGWKNQLPDELGVLLTYRFQRRFAFGPSKDDGPPEVELDVTPSATLALGNVQTYLGTGLVVRFGKNIAGFPAEPLEPTRGIGDVIQTVRRVCAYKIFVECYALVGAEARYVARNVFLDGSTWKESHSVDKEHFVYDLLAGFRTRIVWRDLTLDYLFVRRSNEFSPVPIGAKHPRGRHDFGSFQIRMSTFF